VLPHATSEGGWGNEEEPIVVASTVDTEGGERRKNKLEEARCLNRLPQFPARPLTAYLAQLTSIAYGLDNKVEVERVE
jgi:hypothetical protein